MNETKLNHRIGAIGKLKVSGGFDLLPSTIQRIWSMNVALRNRAKFDSERIDAAIKLITVN